MKKYKKVDVLEQQLEDLVRQHADAIEEGLVYVDHQRRTESGRLDVLLVDSGHSLVVAELKVVEDDGMLLQGLDYYDYLSGQVEALARLHKNHKIDPTQQIRLFLIAPTFSQTLINRCKWIDAPLSLFTYSCLRFEGDDELVPVFSEQAIPTPPEAIEVHKVDDHLVYMTDPGIRSWASKLLADMREWKTGRISIDATKYAVSMKIDGKVFGYLHPRRKHFVIATYNAEDKWTEYPIHTEDDLQNVIPLMKNAMERRLRRGLPTPSRMNHSRGLPHRSVFEGWAPRILPSMGFSLPSPQRGRAMSTRPVAARYFEFPNRFMHTRNAITAAPDTMPRNAKVPMAMPIQ